LERPEVKALMKQGVIQETVRTIIDAKGLKTIRCKVITMRIVSLCRGKGGVAAADIA
jgi:hypothetical protein